jgi:hypothetical protein
MLGIGDDWIYWERTTANGGHPQTWEKYKKVVEGTLEVPRKNH